MVVDLKYIDKLYVIVINNGYHDVLKIWTQTT